MSDQNITSDLKSDRMLEALERLEAVKADLKHDWADPGSHLHLAIEGLKNVLAQQLLMERRQSAALLEAGADVVEVSPLSEVRPLVIKDYNGDPLGHSGHPPADRGGSEAGCYS